MGLVAELLASPHLFEGLAIAVAFVFLSGYYGDFTEGFAYKGFPRIGWDNWQLTNHKAKVRFISSARELITEGFKQVR
jgi:hypothetical protein